ncbi:hypothetical protein F5876DRAFT_82821 [Lentinula aff. lateritia]|uniref:Uncharacterized protein n=1 Tax=Lentinula aff. lateritia TaxID=2804960 RepID=A0ACC1TJ76_9AGAR|nr:hypothetical protein F5876DRAFT_82821 [Lentinula aff. lateritia]
MSADQSRAPPHTPSPLLPPLTALGEVPSPDPESDGELEQDQLAFTLELPSRPQLQLFETVFNTGKPLSGDCQDDPLWLLLAEDLAYSHRFLELHGTPAHKSTWGIPLGVWREYDAALHARTSSTSTLLELNMLDELDTADADQHELQKFLALQQGEAAIAAKRKRARSPSPVAGPSKNIQSGAHKKRSRRKSPVAAATPDSPLRIRLVVPPGRLVVASPSVPAPPRAFPSQMEVPPRDLPIQGPSDLARLAAVAEAHSGLVQQAVSSPPVPPPIKGAGQDLLFLQHASYSPSHFAPRCSGENSSLTSALRNTSHALESRQREVEQLRSSNREVREHEVEYRRVLEQFRALDEALPGAPGRSLLERFQKVQEDLLDATWERKIAVEKLSTSTRRNSHLTTSLLYQQGIVDESNALATRQRCLVEELQEEVHRARGRAAFVDQMIKEYPDEGYYEVVLPPLSQLEGDLNKAREDLCRVATFAHRLYRSDPATVLHHHYRYLGAIIEAVVAFLCRGLESDDLNVAVHNFQLALDYMQAAPGVHGDMYLRSSSSIQGFFNNAVDEDEGLYRMVLEHSRFDNDGPFLTAAQHAGFAPPPDSSLEPPLHRRILALSTALPHSDGAGRWDDIVPALPSIDQLTADWEQLMLQYLHHIVDTLLSGPDPPVPMSSMGSVPESSGEVNVEQSLEAPIAQVSSPSAGSHPLVPLFLPEQESPTSPLSCLGHSQTSPSTPSTRHTLPYFLPTFRTSSAPPQALPCTSPSIPDITPQTTFTPTRIQDPPNR